MKYKILMIGKPGGNLVRTYDWHIKALNNDSQKRYRVDCIHSLGDKVNLANYNIFWFYAKAFQPQLYHTIKQLMPHSKTIFGPNILLDKPDLGPSDEWDNWYINHCNPDIHLDQVAFYSDHVNKFLREDIRKVSRCLNKCIELDDNLFKPDTKKVYDCLIYSKKRRYDVNFEDFRYELLLLLEKNNIKFCEIPAGKFGKYERKDYFDLLNKSKVTVNLSLDECPGILNYESMFLNVPVIGSPHNVPITSAKALHVLNTDEMTSKYLVRKKSAAEKYFKKIKAFLSGDIKLESNHREWVLKETSFKKYCDRLENLIKEVK